jgi:hypothetical protein
VLSEWVKIVAEHDYELVPFLVDQWFYKNKIFADLVTKPISYLLIVFDNILLSVWLIRAI